MQRIIIPLTFIEVIKAIGISNLPSDLDIGEKEINRIFRSLTARTKQGNGYYNEAECASLGVREISRDGAYIGYANKEQATFSNGKQFFRPHYLIEILVWIWGILSVTNIWPLDI